MFYRFGQNNPGGFFDGPQVLIVEASSSQEAEELATEAGVYFDGVASGRDCECCGDRWFRDPDGFATLKEAIASIPDWRTPDEDSSVYRVVRRPSTDEHESRE